MILSVLYNYYIFPHFSPQNVLCSSPPLSHFAAMEIILHCFARCLTFSSICTFNYPQCALPSNIVNHYVISECNMHVHSSLLLPRYDVFLNHRGADVKESVASLIFHNLHNKGFKVFLDKNSIQVGEYIPKAIEEAIYSSNVHLLIFSANYAESVWCLKELEMILKTRAPVIPVFYGVEPSELRMRDEKSVYSRAFQEHKQTGNFEPHVLQEWKKALHQVSYIKGYVFRGDQGELLEQIAMNVAELMDNLRFQSK